MSVLRMAVRRGDLITLFSLLLLLIDKNMSS